MTFSVETVSQVGIALQQGTDVAAFPSDWQSQAVVPEFLYRPRCLLVRDADIGVVTAVLSGLGVDPVTSEQVIPGLTRLRWTATGVDFAAILGALAGVGAGGLATPEHLLYVCGHCCAATEPWPVPDWQGPAPRVQLGEGAVHPLCGKGAGTRVRVYDTGLLDGAAQTHPWLVGVVAVDGQFDDPFGGDGTLLQDGGHGTFDAGCLRCAAPEADVEVVHLDVGPTLGGIFEGDLAVRLAADVTAWTTTPTAAPDVLVVGYAGTTYEQQPLLTFELLQSAFEALGLARAALGALLVVAPAGNDGGDVPNFPAALPWVVSVGSTAPNWRDRAWFTNHHPSVDVYAPGEDIVNAYPVGSYLRKWDWEPASGSPEPPDALGDTRAFGNGAARWSGTSFAAPLVAGLVAARMSTADETAVEAWAWLRAVARSQAVTGTGPVLLPGQGCCSAC